MKTTVTVCFFRWYSPFFRVLHPVCIYQYSCVLIALHSLTLGKTFSIRLLAPQNERGMMNINRLSTHIYTELAVPLSQPPRLYRKVVMHDASVSMHDASQNDLPFVFKKEVA